MAFKTLKETRDDIRNRLDERIGQFWDDSTELDIWINEAATEIARRSETLLDSKSYTLTASKAEYEMPEDMLRISVVEYRRTDNNKRFLESKPFPSMHTVWGSNRDRTGQPSYYTTWGFPGDGGEIILYPAPSETVNDGLRVYYYRTPRKATEDDDPVEVQSGWTDLVPLYVEVVARRKDGADRRWSEALQLFEARLENMIRTTRRLVDQPAYISQDRYLPWHAGNPID